MVLFEQIGVSLHFVNEFIFCPCQTPSPWRKRKRVATSDQKVTPASLTPRRRDSRLRQVSVVQATRHIEVGTVCDYTANSLLL